MRHAVKIDLPHASSQKEDTKPAQVNVSIEADGNVLWDDQKVDDDGLRAKIAQAAQANAAAGTASAMRIARCRMRRWPM